MAASQYQLDNLCAAVDRNRLQISGGTEEVMHQDDVVARFESFGWNVVNVADGNDVSQLAQALDAAEECKGRPTLIIANTVKGYGSLIMENKASWHHHVPTEEEYRQISESFRRKLEEAEHE